MKISFLKHCWKCNTPKSEVDMFVTMNPNDNKFEEINEDYAYELTCPKGHKLLMVIHVEKFEMLFEMATMALMDGYAREAVSSYASSLERFLEYSIQVACLKHGVQYETFLKSWGSLGQSERQLGAFLILKLLDSTPVKWDSNKAKFRNDVIHNGYMASRQEAIDYGQYVLNFIREHIALMHKDSQKQMDDLRHIKFEEKKKKFSHIVDVGTASVPTVIGLNQGGTRRYDDKNLEEIIPMLLQNGFHKDYYRP